MVEISTLILQSFVLPKVCEAITVDFVCPSVISEFLKVVSNFQECLIGSETNILG